MLIDTSGFLCFNESREAYHEKAVELYDSAKMRLTTSYVLAEYTALAQVRGLARRETIKFSTRILNEQAIEIVWIDENLHRQAVELIEKREDKNYSLCNAVSFVLMRTRGITEALTTDKHFEQEGFVRLLK
ncbi:MAG TPA: PIN domain-containing protein [Pyrinomonadaceae bacterium]|nr:PIN domain-containing protein [Pyrinomonadaceae bacterium]